MGIVALALDCGTHAVRLLAFDATSGESTLCGSLDIPLSFPQPGWVEVDPEMLASAAERLVRDGVAWAAEMGHDIAALGIANMRETAFAWHRDTGLPLHAGVMWMSQQSVPVVQRWHAAGLGPLIRERTGLSNDAFFFGSKVAWLFDEVPDVGTAAEAGALAVGTVDTWLIYRLTGGRVHRTDVSNGSRTQLLGLRTAAWDPQLCRALGIPLSCLPEVTPSMSAYGVTDAALCGQEIPITGVIADQQASLLGHGCEQRGSAKATFGTSGVVSLNTGEEILLRPGMVTSIGWTDSKAPPIYEVEGSAFHSGYTMTWLSERTGHPIGFDADGQRPPLPPEHRVYVLPSFTVMGAPRWPSGRGAVIAGLAMDTTTRDIMRAGLEAMAFQAYDMFAAIGDTTDATPEVNVDGGGVSSDYMCRLFAELLDRDVVRPNSTELTSVGVAKAALRGAGYDVDVHFGQNRSAAERFHPTGDSYARDGYQRWVELVEKILR